MIVVTGSKRSGTSMWMQVLRAAGYPVVGDAFPHAWKNTIAEANPRGFWESPWRRGIWWETNPDPTTGVYVPADAVETHAVKIFPRGVVRTERAYLGRVIVCVRNWREQVASITRLYAMEHASKERLEGRTLAPRRRMPPVLEWWDENFALLRDLSLRRYEAKLVSYEAVLEQPAERVPLVLAWVGGGNTEAAVAAVDGSLRTHRDRTAWSEQDAAYGLRPEQVAVLDTYCAMVHAGAPLPQALLDAMDVLHGELSVPIARARSEVDVATPGRRRVRYKQRGGAS
jgi:hypothetical protein